MPQPPPPVRDEPVRRYLQALSEHAPRPAGDIGTAARYKRYADTARHVLPWRTAVPDPPTAPTVLGALLLDLLGIVRLIWSLPIEATGRVSSGAPRLLLGRPAPSGGALHPIEAYLVTGDDAALPAGVYHYDPVHHALELVRAGDHRATLAATLTVPPATRPDTFVVLTAVFTRTMARYGDFGYRLQCQETGILLAQALAVAERLDVAAAAHLCFGGAGTDRLLGLDGSREGALAVLSLRLPAGACVPAGTPAGGPDPGRPDGTVAVEDRPPPPMPAGLHAWALHAAGRDAAVRVLSPAAAPPPTLTSPHPSTPPGPVPLPAAVPVRPADGVPHRGSPFAGYPPEAIGARQLATLLDAASAGYPGDLPGAGEGPVTVTLCLLVLRVDGVPRGVYRYDRERHRLDPLGGEAAVAMVVGGPLLPNTRLALRGAAAVLLPVGDPITPAGRIGPAWYRLQQIETGLVTHRATLAGAALGLASRIHSEGTNDVTDAALGLHATDWRSLSFLAVGARTAKLVRRVPDLPTSPPRKEVPMPH